MTCRAWRSGGPWRSPRSRSASAASVLAEDCASCARLLGGDLFGSSGCRMNPACVDAGAGRPAPAPAAGVPLSRSSPRPTAPAVLDAPRQSPRWRSCARRAPTPTARWPPPSTLAGFEPWDVTMTDLLAGRITLERFRGLAAVGGFSYADVLDSRQGLGRRRSASTTACAASSTRSTSGRTPSASASATAASSSPCSAGCRGAASPTPRSRASSTTPPAASSRASPR